MQSTSRSFLLKWLNRVAAPIERIEDVGKGVVLCSLMKKLDQEFPAFKKEPWNENDYLHNLKLVEIYLIRKGVKMYFPIEKMVKLRLQDNLEVVQQMYKFVTKENATLQMSEDATSRKADKVNSEDEVVKLKKCAGVIKNERDFYYNKLLEIERVLKENTEEISESKRNELLEILYKSQ